MREEGVVALHVPIYSRCRLDKFSKLPLSPFDLTSKIGPIQLPLPRTESLAMPEAVSASGRVRNLNAYGHVNTFP